VSSRTERPQPSARSWLATVALALAVGAVVWLAVVGLTPSPTFEITSTITSSPGCTATALFYPGELRCLTYTVTNPNTFPIKVTSLGIAGATSSAPAACSSSNLDLRKTTFSGSLTVHGNGRNATSVPIELLDNGNQDGCEGVTFSFSYTVALTYRAA
jgi:hypothetical protein